VQYFVFIGFGDVLALAKWLDSIRVLRYIKNSVRLAVRLICSRSPLGTGITEVIRNEENFSAEQPEAEEQARVSEAHEQPRWSYGCAQKAPEGPEARFSVRTAGLVQAVVSGVS